MRDKGSRRQVSGDGKREREGKQRENKKMGWERKRENEKRDFLCHLLAFEFTGHIFMGQCLGSIEE